MSHNRAVHKRPRNGARRPVADSLVLSFLSAADAVEARFEAALSPTGLSLAKLAVLLFVFIWIRGTLPRMRIDHIMSFAWKFMMPMAFTCLIAAAAWHYQSHSFTRWLWSLGILLVVYFALSRFLGTNKKLSARTYRFAE